MRSKFYGRRRRRSYMRLRKYKNQLKRIPKSRKILESRTKARKYRREYKQRQKILTILRK